jgi:hypothetical protein
VSSGSKKGSVSSCHSDHIRVLWLLIVCASCARTPIVTIASDTLECPPIHGGYPGFKAAPLRLSRAQRADSVLNANARGRLVVRTYSARDTKVVANAEAALLPHTPNAGRMKGDSGVVILEAPPGRYQLIVRRIGYDRWTDSVTLRSGFQDSALVGLGEPPVCLH